MTCWEGMRKLGRRLERTTKRSISNRMERYCGVAWLGEALTWWESERIAWRSREV